MIKRYGRAIFDDDTKGVGQFENGGYVLFTDHESAIAAKDAEIDGLKRRLEARRGIDTPALRQSIAEQVRERCLRIVGSYVGTDPIADRIRAADLSDISGNNQEVKPNPESVSRDRSAD